MSKLSKIALFSFIAVFALSGTLFLILIFKTKSFSPREFINLIRNGETFGRVGDKQTDDYLSSPQGGHLKEGSILQLSGGRVSILVGTLKKVLSSEIGLNGVLLNLGQNYSQQFLLSNAIGKDIIINTVSGTKDVLVQKTELLKNEHYSDEAATSMLNKHLGELVAIYIPTVVYDRWAEIASVSDFVNCNKEFIDHFRNGNTDKCELFAITIQVYE